MPPESTASLPVGTGTTGSVAPTPSSAPATAAGGAPSSSPAGTPVSGSSPAAPSSSADAPAAAPIEGDAAQASAEPPSFDWEKWDPEDIDSLPENHREIGKRIKSRWDDRVKSHTEKELALKEREMELDQTARIYSAVLSGDPDPRISEYEQRAQAREREYLDAQAKWEAEKASWAQKEKEWQAWQRSEAERYVADFKRRHPDLDTDEAKRTTFRGLLKDKWDPEVAAELVGMSEEVRAEAVRLRKEGVPEQHAVKFAVSSVAERKPAPPPPRPGSQITSGSEGSIQSPAAQKDLGAAKTFQQRREIAISNNMRRKTRAA